MTDRAAELRKMVADLEGEAIFIDQDGDACLAPSGRDMNLVALPARDDDGSLLRPDAWAAMVNRFNEFPPLATDLAAALERIAALEGAIEEATDPDAIWEVLSDTIDIDVSYMDLAKAVSFKQRAALAALGEREVG